MVIRATTRQDIAGLRAIIEATDLFPSHLLDSMLVGFLGGVGQDTWLTDADNEPAAMAYLAPERMTVGTWNLLLMAVSPDQQGRGRGSALVAHIELMLLQRGARLLLVETSSLLAFERARSFYHRCGFEEEARIRGFYQAGEDKIIFSKAVA